MPAQPPSPAQRRAKQSVTGRFSQDAKFLLRQLRQTVLQPSVSKQIDRLICEVSHGHSGHRQAQLVLTLSRRQAAAKGAYSWCRLSMSAGTSLCSGQSRHCRASEAIFHCGDPGNLVTVSEPGIRRTRENNLGEKHHHTRDNRREEGLKSQRKLHASRYQFALQEIQAS